MRKQFLFHLTGVALAIGGPAFAQATKPLPQRSIAEAVDSWVTNTEREVVAAADAMPPEKYAFAPLTTMGDFAGVRTFAQQVKHLAADNYWMAALMMEEQGSPEMSRETGRDSVKTKAQVMTYLRGSFAALHAAVGTITAANVVTRIASPSDWQVTRVSFAIDAIAHSYNHYGQMVEYLRMNGIVPPGSRPAASSDRPAP